MNPRAPRACKSALLAAAVLVGVSLSSCTVNASQDHVAIAAGAGVDAESDALWEHRTPFVGDNSRVIALISDADFGPGASYTIKLQTEKPPYGLTVAFPGGDVSGKPLAAVNFTRAATKVLGTVGNLEWVKVTGEGADVFSLTAKQASETLGFDVKELGQDQRKLTDYVTAERD